MPTRPLNGIDTVPGATLARTSVPRTIFRRTIATATVERSLSFRRSVVPAGATFVLPARATTAVALLATRKLVFVSFALPTTGATVSGGGVVGPPPPPPPSSGATGAAVTATTRDVDALLPALSVAVIVTVAAPGSPNVCETTLPSASEPSPKSQCSVVPLSVSAAAAAGEAGGLAGDRGVRHFDRAEAGRGRVAFAHAHARVDGARVLAGRPGDDRPAAGGDGGGRSLAVEVGDVLQPGDVLGRAELAPAGRSSAWAPLREPNVSRLATASAVPSEATTKSSMRRSTPSAVMRFAAAGGAPAGVTEALTTSWKASGVGRPVEPTSSAPWPSAAAVSDVARVGRERGRCEAAVEVAERDRSTEAAVPDDVAVAAARRRRDVGARTGGVRALEVLRLTDAPKLGASADPERGDDAGEAVASAPAGASVRCS